MSRVAPIIPVDLNRRAVLVDDLVSRVPRCDCCPTETCESCDAPLLAQPVFGNLDFRLSSDWVLAEGSPGFPGCTQVRSAFGAGPFPDNEPFIIYRDAFNFQLSSIPGGGVVSAHWRWHSSITLNNPAFFFPEDRVGLSVLLDVFLTADGRMVYALVLYLGTADTIGIRFPGGWVWFEQGMLPPDESPCEPSLFPVRINFDFLTNPGWRGAAGGGTVIVPGYAGPVPPPLFPGFV